MIDLYKINPGIGINRGMIRTVAIYETCWIIFSKWYGYFFFTSSLFKYLTMYLQSIPTASAAFLIDLYSPNFSPFSEKNSIVSSEDNKKEEISKIEEIKEDKKEAKRKIGETHKDKKISEEQKEKMRNRVVSEETRKKLSDRSKENTKGEKNPMYGRKRPDTAKLKKHSC